MKISGALIILGVVLLLAGGVYLLTQGQTYQPASNNNLPANNSPATGNTSGTTSSNPQTYNIDIAGFAFAPSTLNVRVGDVIIWTNSDSVTHTITSDSGNELKSSSLSNGETYTHTFNTAGTYNYHCSIHSTMKGNVIVS